MILRLRYLQVLLLLVVAGCDGSTSDTKKSEGRPVTDEVSQVRLSGRLSATEYAPGEDIEMTAIVKNNGRAPVTVEEGGFTAVFIVEGEAKTFLQSVRASYASGVKTVTVNPGQVYEEPFIIPPKDWGKQRKLATGKYRVRVCYHSRDSSWRPEVHQGADCIDEGVVRALDSEEVFVHIK
jgi:hypothetical protein